MRIAKCDNGWVGFLDKSDPREKQDIDILGTDMVALPFTAMATERVVRDFYNGNPVRYNVTL